MSDINTATRHAIAQAKNRGAEEISPDDLLLGCLMALARFGVTKFGPWVIDLEAWGVEWMTQPGKSGPKVSYSDAVVQIFDRAGRIARADGPAGVHLPHLLAAFAQEESGLMGKLKRELNIESPAWRAAAADVSPSVPPHAPALPETTTTREYLTPEGAAAALGIHVQTLRNYVRTGKLPAFRLAGERALRIRRGDLEKVLEPLLPEKETQ